MKQKIADIIGLIAALATLIGIPLLFDNSWLFIFSWMPSFFVFTIIARQD